MFDRINKIDFDPLHDVWQRLAGGGRRSWQGPGPSIQYSPSPASRLPPAASPSSPRDLSHLKFMNTNEVPVFRDPKTCCLVYFTYKWDENTNYLQLAANFTRRAHSNFKKSIRIFFVDYLANLTTFDSSLNPVRQSLYSWLGKICLYKTFFYWSSLSVAAIAFE